MIRTALVLPTPPALLAPRSTIDPVHELRLACAEAVVALPEADRLVVLAAPVSDANVSRGVTEPLGHRIAAHLLGGRDFEPQLALPYAAAALLEIGEPTTLLVMADGSARRDEQSPGHFHPDAVAFDDSVEAALRSGDAEALAALDPALGDELWCEGIPGFRALGEVARDSEVVAETTYPDAPHGVAWWVARWNLA
jgi:hypothetical protein